LSVVQAGEARHAFIGPPVANHRPQQIAALVMIEDRGTDQVRRARAGRIFAMAEAASGAEQGLSSLCGGWIFRTLLARRGSGLMLLGGSCPRQRKERSNGPRREYECFHKTSVFQTAYSRQLDLSFSEVQLRDIGDR
jgi:hypothetical protein